jgi:hypothetical protein
LTFSPTESSGQFFDHDYFFRKGDGFAVAPAFLPTAVSIWEAVMVQKSLSIGFTTRLLFGFIAGFFATLIFHQLTLTVLWGAGLAPFRPFPMAATQPFGVPAVFSLAFWGGVWGIPFAWIDGGFRRRWGYWVTAFLFGAILPSLVALFVVLPLKGLPMGGGWHVPLLVTAFLINGAWGIGTGIILGILCKRFSRSRAAPA